MPASPDRESVLARVSRETGIKLDRLVEELARWQSVKNLVGPSTLAEVWHRHLDDSLQIAELAPDARRWLDVGAGAGFPGLVIAIGGAEQPGMEVTLVESNARKCAYLRHVARVTGAPARIVQDRIEHVAESFVGRTDVVTARAVAPLTQLLAWSQPILAGGAVGLFPKGRDYAAELTEAQKSWTFNFDLTPSRTERDGRMIRVTGLEPRGVP